MIIISSEKNMDCFFIVVFIAPWHQICTFQHGFDQDICYDLEYQFAHFRNIRVLRIDYDCLPVHTHRRTFPYM